MRSLTDAPFIDFVSDLDDDAREAQIAALRAQTAVCRMPIGATIIRRDEVRALLGDPRLVSAIPMLVALQGVNDGPIREMVAAAVISMDGEDHSRIRRLVNRSFTPSAANRHRAAMRAVVHELIDEFAANGTCDFVKDFGDHYPVQVICEVLGVPREDHDDFARWGDSITFVLSLELSEHLAEVQEAAGSLRGYVERIVAERRASPRDDLVTSLVQASEGGDHLNEMELFSLIGGLLFAGYDTTRNQLGLALYTFCQHPEQWALLAEHPELAPRAVDEVMRLYGAVSGVPRVTNQDIEIDDWLIPAYTIVFMSVASANRDERVYANSLDFDITAAREEPHLTFGSGPHFCLGANLARAEMEEALTILSRRLRNPRLDGEPTWRMGTGIAGPTTLPLAFELV